MNAAPCSWRVRMKRISDVSRSTSRIGRFIVPGMPKTCATRSRRRQSTTACAPVITGARILELARRDSPRVREGGESLAAACEEFDFRQLRVDRGELPGIGLVPVRD